MERSLTDAITQPSSGSISHETALVAPPNDGSASQKVPQVKDEPLSQVKCESVKEIKTESSSSTHEVKVEQEESETKGESVGSVKQEEQAPEPDSEHSRQKGQLKSFSVYLRFRNPELGNVNKLMKKER